MNKRWWAFMWWFDFDRCLRDIGKMHKWGKGNKEEDHVIVS